MEDSLKVKSKAHDDQKRREKLEEELKKMEDSLKVKSKAHYISSEFYSQWDIKLQYASYITGMLGTSGGFFSKFAWKTIAQNYPRLGPVAASTAATMSLFAVLVNIRILPYSPAALHEVHFASGIECQYLKRRVRFFAKLMFGTWTYHGPRLHQHMKETLLERKKEVDSRVLPQDWAYQEALKKIEMRRKEKELQEENKDAKKDGILASGLRNA